MEIAPNIHRIKCKFDENRMAYVHLLVGENAIMLVDTCCVHNPEQEIIPYMQSIGIESSQLTYIVISHSDLDHQGGNNPMKQAAPQAIMMCHNLDRRWIESEDALIQGRYMQFDNDHGFETSQETIEALRSTMDCCPMDMTLEGGEAFRLSPDWSVQAVHTPGHTWGHLAIYDPKSKTIVAGEAALWNAILDTKWNPVLPPTYCYVDTYLATLNRLMNMDIEIYSPAHWQVQQGEQIAEFLRESRNFCLYVEDKLLEIAQNNSPFTLKDAITLLGSRLRTWEPDGDSLLTFPITGNLERLTNRGLLIRERNNENIVTWRLT